MQELPGTVMKQAFYDRDSSFDHLFVVGVTTTNIFCRPSCPARKPLESNIRFFKAASEAMFAGFRPCLRCRPLEQSSLPAWATRLIAEIETNPELRIRAEDLRRRGVDPATARRTFQKHFGISFHAYARARRLGVALSTMREGGSIDDATFSSGFESHSGFRAAFERLFGTSPGRAGDARCIQSKLVDTQLGNVVLAATGEGLCMLEFSDRRMLERQIKTLQRRMTATVIPGSNAHLEKAEVELRAYLAGELREFTVPFVAPGSEFQQRVWSAVRAIPYGETRSYEDVAAAVDIPAGMRAVGRANGDNRLALVIPCHRVVNKSGEMGGYGGGLWRKQRLLEMEQRVRDEAVPRGIGHRED